MNRRGFLKACAFIGGAIAVPDFSLIIPSQEIPRGMSWFSTVRELVAYDIGRDAYFLRHDVLGETEQWGVDQVFHSKEALVADLLQARERSSLLLGNQLRHRGITLDSLRPVPIPRGYVHPDWMTA